MLDNEKAESTGTVENYILGDTLLDLHSVTIAADTIAYLKNKKEFGYAKNLDSLLKDLQKKSAGESNQKTAVKAASFFDRLFNASFLKVFLWLLAIIFIGFILYNLFLSEGIFKKNNPVKSTAEQVGEEELFLTQDYNALLHQAYKLQDFRLGTRYLFLKTLQRLNEQSLIEYAADKTNSKYVYEISADKRNDFAAIVMNYEYVWYGNVNISKEIFDRIEPKFAAFLNKI